MIDNRPSCPNCGGTLDGDGYSRVVSCEFADPEDYECLAPDSNPVYCRPLVVEDGL